MIKALFICTHNRLRSPTAEHIFSDYPKVETDSAGLGADAELVLSTEQIEWATHIFVMEKKHRAKLKQNFQPYLKDKKIICLEIPDQYDYMQAELVKRLQDSVSRYLKP